MLVIMEAPYNINSTQVYSSQRQRLESGSATVIKRLIENDQVGPGFESRRTNSPYPIKVTHRLERAMLGSVVDNGLPQHRPDSWQALQLRQIGCIDMHRIAGGGRPCGRRRSRYRRF